MFSLPIYASWPLNFKRFKRVNTEKWVLLMNGIPTYSWAVIGIAILAQAFSYGKSYLLSTLFKKLLFLHQFSSRIPVKMTKSPSVTSLCSLWIYVWLHQLSVRRDVDSCWVPLSHSFVETGLMKIFANQPTTTNCKHSALILNALDL